MAGSIVEATSRRTTAEAPAPQLVLHRAQQVIRLVRDGEVRVARDPEEVVAEDLHAGKELSRWRAISDSSGTNTS